jgi:hypothetical protein
MEPAITAFEQADQELFYNCNECPSLIEIQEVNENDNTIKFICLNKNKEKTIDIKEYFEDMQNYRNNIQDKCHKHDNEIYEYYCMDCKCNLCSKCMKEKTHKKHKIEIICNIQPEDEDLKIIEERIEEYENELKNLKDEKEKRINELKTILNNDKMKENERF